MAKFKVIKNRKKFLVRRRIRRIVTLFSIVAFFAFMIYRTFQSRTDELNQTRLTLQYYQSEFDEIMLRQGFYTNQIARLNDEDYVAMLARGRHFRSRENEIIFRIIEQRRDVEDLEYPYTEEK